MNRPERPELMVAERPPRRRRLWLWMIVVVLLSVGLFAAIFAFPIVAFTAKGFPAPPPASVSTAAARFEAWQPLLQVVGSLKPVQGADLSVEVAGIVDEVNFDSGGDVAAGAQIIRLRDTDDVAKLHTLEAARDLWQANFTRDQAQLATAAHQPGAVRYHLLQSEIFARPDRRAAGDRRQEDLAGALRRPSRHSFGQCRPISRTRHRGGDAAGARSDLLRFLFAATAAATDQGWPKHRRESRCLSGNDFHRQDHHHRSEGRSRHAQRRGARDASQCGPQAAARNVRDGGNLDRHGAALHHAAADGDHLQPLWQHGLSGAGKGRSRQENKPSALCRRW